MTESNSIAGATASNIDGEFLWGFWYPALRSDELRGRALVNAWSTLNDSRLQAKAEPARQRTLAAGADSPASG